MLETNSIRWLEKIPNYPQNAYTFNLLQLNYSCVLVAPVHVATHELYRTSTRIPGTRESPAAAEDEGRWAQVGSRRRRRRRAGGGRGGELCSCSHPSVAKPGDLQAARAPAARRRRSQRGGGERRGGKGERAHDLPAAQASASRRRSRRGGGGRRGGEGEG